MATFEGGNASPPSATTQASGTFLWPMFFGANATQTSGVVDANNARAKVHIEHRPGEYHRPRIT